MFASDVCWLHIHSLPVSTGRYEVQWDQAKLEYYLFRTNFADDLQAELIELLAIVLDVVAIEAASVRPEVKWQKTTVQALAGKKH